LTVAAFSSYTNYKTFPILEQSADRFVAMAKEDAPEVEVIVLEPGKNMAGRLPRA